MDTLDSGTVAERIEHEQQTADVATAPVVDPEAPTGGCPAFSERPCAAEDGVRQRPPPEDTDEPEAKQRKLLSSRDIFLRGGPKKELGVGQLFSGEDDLPLLRSRMDALESAWMLAHEASSRNLSYGLWPPGSCAVEALLCRGKGWNAFGQSYAKRILMTPEEALFLMESDRLLVFRAVGDEAPMSLHAGYAAAAEAGLTSERYAVFAHLCRLGFVVRRHSSFALRFEEYVSTKTTAPAETHVEPHVPMSDVAHDSPGAVLEHPDAAARPDGELDAASDEMAQPQAEDVDNTATAQEAPRATVMPDDQDADAAQGPSREWWRASAVWPQPPGAGFVLVDALPSEAQSSADAWHPVLLYDVYSVQRMYYKKWAGKPLFRVVMSTHRPPNAEEMAVLAKQNGDVSLKCIVVKPGIVIGFDFGVVTCTSLPRQKGNR